MTNFDLVKMRKIQILSLTALLLLAFGLVEINCEESNSEPESSSKCARVAGEVHRFDNRTNKCYKVGTKGPCGELMIFYADPLNPDNGECDCDINLRCHRPLIYWPPTNRCYLAYEQGPCKPFDWLVFTARSSPTCRKNPCIHNQMIDEMFESDESEEDTTTKNETDKYWIEAYGECVQTTTQGFCQYPHEVVAINGFTKKVKPHCTVVETTCKSSSVPSLFCAPGQKWAVEGKCNRPSCKKTKRWPSRRGHRGQRHRRIHRRFQHHNRPQNFDLLDRKQFPEILEFINPNESAEEENEINEDAIAQGYSPSEAETPTLPDMDDEDDDYNEIFPSTTTEPPTPRWAKRVRQNLQERRRH